jgi:hypothetical protein
MKIKNLLLTALATLGLTAATMAQNVPNYVPTNGLVGWWPFNANANDESGNGNNGVVNGAILTADRFGNTDKAYNFDGVSNFISVADNNSLDFTTQLTVSAWALIPDYSYSLGDGERTVLGKQRFDGATGFSLTANSLYHNSKYGFIAIDNNNLASVISDDSLDLNIWVNLVASYDGTTIKLYRNGILENQNSANVNFINSIEPLFFGKEFNSNTNGRFFKGKIDDIGIWNRALTQQEITDLYNGNICYQTITVTDTLLINMGITGFNPVTYNNTIKIFPNPTNDHITIDYGNLASLSGYQLKIINSLSQNVFQTNITQQSDYLNLTTWGGNGLYFVQIIDQQGNIIDIRKIVLQ